MTKAELNRHLAKAANIDWHRTVEETFSFTYLNYHNTLIGVGAIYTYVMQQIKGWEEMGDPLPEQFVESLTYFENIRIQIEAFVTNYSESQTENLDTLWAGVRNQIQNVNSRPLPHYLPEVAFLLKVYREAQEYFLGAYNFILAISYNTNSKELLYGAILAYEFVFRNSSDLLNRRSAEKISLAKLKSDFKGYINEAESELNSHLKDANEKYNEYVKAIDKLKDEKELGFTEWFEDTKSNHWDTWYAEKLEKIQKLEETYETNLKLQKPAKYWEKKSTIYYKQGDDTRKLVILIVALTSVFLAGILIIAPDWIFNVAFNGNTTAIIRWSIVFITLLTLIAFTIKALTKYMFSSYHLARDAEERHTLTFFYLALLKDTEVKDEDRKLILQSLFSRVETGLLKDDSSPTMPSEVITKVLGR